MSLKNLHMDVGALRIKFILKWIGEYIVKG